MAEEKKEQEIQFEKPKGGVSSVEPEIHVMPEKFRGVTLGAKIPEVSKPREPKAPQLAKTEPVKKPAAKEPSPPKVPGVKKKFPWWIIIVILVILAALGASIFLVLQSYNIPAEEPEEVAVVEPEPESAPEPEPEPVVSEPEEEMATEEATIPATSEVSMPATSEVTIPVPEEEPEPAEEVSYSGGIDADSDGLTDLEEGLYETDPRLPDTDLDGFLDGNEVYHLYNPGGTAPVTLLESGLVRRYANDQNRYEIYYPTAWQLDVSKGSDFVMFVAESGEWVQVLAEENPEDLSLTDWYLGQAPGVEAADLKPFSTKSGIEGLQSPDRLTAYFKQDSRIYAVSLNLGAKTVIEFRRTYEMMLNSFKFSK